MAKDSSELRLTDYPTALLENIAAHLRKKYPRPTLKADDLASPTSLYRHAAELGRAEVAEELAVAIIQQNKEREHGRTRPSAS